MLLTLFGASWSDAALLRFDVDDVEIEFFYDPDFDGGAVRCRAKRRARQLSRGGGRDEQKSGGWRRSARRADTHYDEGGTRGR